MTLQEIHQRFFGFRNGIVAKAFHDTGHGHNRVFGLQLPQIAAIAREIGYDNDMGRQLWEEKDCRESRLLSCYLFDPSSLSLNDALNMAEDVQTREEADILAWRLLRLLPFAKTLPDQLTGYIREALLRNLES